MDDISGGTLRSKMLFRVGTCRTNGRETTSTSQTCLVRFSRSRTALTSSASVWITSARSCAQVSLLGYIQSVLTPQRPRYSR